MRYMRFGRNRSIVLVGRNLSTGLTITTHSHGISTQQNLDVQQFCFKGPQPLLRTCSRSACVKIKVSDIRNRLNYCVTFVIYIYIYIYNKLVFRWLDTPVVGLYHAQMS